MPLFIHTSSLGYRIDYRVTNNGIFYNLRDLINYFQVAILVSTKIQNIRLAIMKHLV